MAPPSLAEVLADVPDPRDARGCRHPLAAILGLVALGLLLGRTSLAGIARLGRLYGAPLAHALGFRRGKTPTKSTLSVVLRQLDPDALEGALSRWACARLTADADLLSLDGKTLRGSRDGAVPGQHLVALYAHKVQAVLAQVRVDCKTNEHKAALRLLGILAPPPGPPAAREPAHTPATAGPPTPAAQGPPPDAPPSPLAGRVVIGDAAFCQRDLAAQLIAAGADYVLIVKDNQPGLAADIDGGFAHEAAARSIAAAFSP